MWILPKQLITSLSVPDTEELTLGCEEFSQLAEQSLMWRSKPSPSRTWSQRWKRVNWIKRLSGQTLKPYHWKRFQRAWRLSLAASRANLSPPQESGKAMKTQGTSSHT